MSCHISRCFKFVVTVVVLILTSVSGYGQSIKITASIDSSYIEMGRHTAVHLNIVQPSGKKLFLQALEDTAHKIEVVKILEPDTAVSSDILNIKQDVIITAFDSGMFVVPAFQYLDGETGGFYSSNTLDLEVRIIHIDNPSPENLKDIKDVYEVPFDWCGVFTNMFYFLGVGLVTLLIYVLSDASYTVAVFLLAFIFALLLWLVIYYGFLCYKNRKNGIVKMSDIDQKDLLTKSGFFAVLGLLGVLIGSYAMTLVIKKRNTALSAEGEEEEINPDLLLPAHEVALAALDKLKEKKPWKEADSNAIKSYYSDLTDILRVYLGRRFEIGAMEMTSDELMDALKYNTEAMSIIEQLKEILNHADMAKFAKVNPTHEECELSLVHAYFAVNNTVKVVAEEQAVPKTDNNKEEKK